MQAEVYSQLEIEDEEAYLYFQENGNLQMKKRMEYQAYFFAGYIVLPESIFNPRFEGLYKSISSVDIDELYQIIQILSNEFGVSGICLKKQLEKEFPDVMEEIMGITQSTYDKNYKRWRERQAVLRKKRMSVQKADDDYYITATYLLKLASKASILFESSEPEEKRLLLNKVVQNATLNGSIVDYDLKKTV